jgi:hypothetical protein
LKVISGGQTGCDQAALRAARACGIETGGWAPKGWLTEEGAAPWLAEYGLVEHESSAYPPRTEANIQDSDATLLIGDIGSPGSRLALRAAERFRKTVCHFSLPFIGNATMYYSWWWGKEFFDLTPDSIATDFLVITEVQILNVAGNRESSNPGIGKAAEAFLAEVFRAWKEQAK